MIMRDGNASMYLGSPRMAEMVIGEKVTLEEMGGARMHTGVSGCGHMLVKTDEEGIDLAKAYLSYFPSHWEQEPPPAPPAAPGSDAVIRDLIPADENKPFDIKALIDALVDAGLVPRGPPALGQGARRRLRAPRGARRSASSPTSPSRRAACSSSTRPTRPRASSRPATPSTCRCSSWPTCPGFMIGTAVERQGIIRHGAKMISAVSEATVPKLSVIVRKAYGAGLYAMAGPAFEPDACLALPTASIAVMGPQAAVNAVFYNQLQAIEDPDERARRTEELRREYAEDIDILHLASELVVDAVDPARGPARRAGQALRAGGRQGARVAAQAQPDHAGVGAPPALLVRRARPERAGRRLVLVVVGARRRAARDRASRPARAGRPRGSGSGQSPGDGGPGSVARLGLGRGRRRRGRGGAAERVARRSAPVGPGSEGGSGSGSGAAAGGAGAGGLGAAPP